MPSNGTPCPLTLHVLARHQCTQVTLARVLDVSQKTVASWVSGRRQPLGPARKLLALLADGAISFEDLARIEARR
jgi:DNA-binding XRE family transcriptional regulator